MPFHNNNNDVFYSTGIYKKCSWLFPVEVLSYKQAWSDTESTEALAFVSPGLDLQEFPIDFMVFQCPLQDQNGLALSEIKFQACASPSIRQEKKVSKTRLKILKTRLKIHSAADHLVLVPRRSHGSILRQNESLPIVCMYT